MLYLCFHASNPQRRADLVGAFCRKELGTFEVEPEGLTGAIERRLHRCDGARIQRRRIEARSV